MACNQYFGIEMENLAFSSSSPGSDSFHLMLEALGAEAKCLHSATWKLSPKREAVAKSVKSAN